MASVFRKVMVADRVPKHGIGYFTDEGYLNYGYNESEGRDLWTCYNDGYKEDPTWWLEEIQLPTEEEIDEYMQEMDEIDADFDHYWFRDGVEYVLHRLKGGSK